MRPDTIPDTTHLTPIDSTAFSALRHRLGKGEVASSILAGSTINLLEIIVLLDVLTDWTLWESMGNVQATGP
jgi:hypothetical protein